MADNKLESQIGDFKSPEELAKELEKNNKRLADRVREISQKAIEADSKDLRKKLQEELTPEEQLEIRETLPNSGVGKVLNKGLTKEEKQAQEAHKEVAGVIGEDNAKNLAKAEGYMKSLGDAWDVAGKLFEEGKWIAAIGVILKGLFGQFSLKAWEKKDEEKENKNNNTENIDKISLPMKILISYAYKGSKEDKDKVINISQTDNFKKLSLKEIHNISQNENALKDWTKNTYPNGGVDFNDVKTLFLLFSNSGDAYKTLKNLNQKGFDENKKLIDVLTYHKEDKNMYIYEKFSNLDTFSLNDGLWEFIKIEKENIDKGEYLSLGINGNILTFILSNEFKLGDNIDTLLQNKTGSINDTESNKIREIINFGTKINTLIQTNKSINLGSNIDLTGSLTLKDITKLFIMLGGETDFNKMNEFQQGFLYFTIPGFLGKQGSWGNFDEGSYITKLGVAIKDATLNSATELPEGVVRFFSNVGNKVVDSFIDILRESGIKIAGGTTEIIKEYPWLVPVMISLVMLYPFAERKTILGAILKKRGISKK